MTTCDHIQDLLAEAGPAALDGPERAHLAGCPDCTRVAAEIERLDQTLHALPTPDAPDALVAKTLAAVQADQRRRETGFNRRHLAGGLAACIVIAAALGLTMRQAPYNPFKHGQTQLQTRSEGPAPEAPSVEGALEEAPVGGAYRKVAPQATTLDDLSATTGTAQGKGDLATSELAETETQGAGQDLFADQRHRNEGEQELWRESDLIAQLESELRQGQRAQSRDDQSEDNKALAEFARGLSSSEKAVGAKTKEAEGFELGDEMANQPAPDALSAPEPAPLGEDPQGAPGRLKAEGSVEELVEHYAAPQSEPLAEDEEKRSNSETSTDKNEALGDQPAKDRLVKRRSEAAPPVPAEKPADRDGAFALNQRLAGEAGRERAQAYLERTRSLDGLTFQAPTGYWANSYIPGDPAMRLLQARLGAWNRAALGQAAPLEQAVRQVAQPFDAPRDAALALYLDADVAAMEGPTRLRIQVGLKGAERQGGHRPAMNVALVVDPRELADPTLGAQVRALVTALERARQPGDRFSLIAAGPDGGQLVAPEDFRHGPIKVALDRLFAGPADPSAATLGLPQAIELASQGVSAGKTEDEVLGANLVLLATAAPLNGDLATLEQIVHRNAVGGVPLSVVSLGGRADLDQIDRLVAAGQGNRRLLEGAAQAETVIDRELHSASRAVARALRLSIRLAPGVKLIDVLDSRPLGEPQAERVREAEQAIDQRLARHLGIAADRGEDEDGIQIVIPNFYAGDSHVVLLDVVAEGPGPIADVTLRYKDVVSLTNDVARAGLSLAAGERAEGPRERNVQKNLVARELAGQLRQAARLLDNGLPQEAVRQLAVARDWLQGLRQSVPGWSNDPGLAADQAVVEDYLAVLGQPAAQGGEQARYLADSLDYAAFRKLQSAAR